MTQFKELFSDMLDPMFIEAISSINITHEDKLITIILLSKITGKDYLTKSDVSKRINDDAKEINKTFTGENKEIEKTKIKTAKDGLSIMSLPTPAEIKNRALMSYLQRVTKKVDSIDNYIEWVSYVFAGLNNKYRDDVAKQWFAKNKSLLKDSEVIDGKFLINEIGYLEYAKNYSIFKDIIIEYKILEI